MKRFLLLVSVVCSLAGVYAQNSNVESAAIYLRNLEMEDAKKAIDAASQNEQTKNDPKMWFYYTAIYDTIYRNPAFANLDKDVVEKFAISCKKCIDTDIKKRYDYYCNVAIINSAFASYNKAIEYYSAKDYTNATKFFNYVLDVMPYDKEKFLAKNNITEMSIILTLADMAIKAKNSPEAKKHLQKLIDMDYNDHIIYMLMANAYLDENDTTKALSYVDMGRTKFPKEKDLINFELYIYQSQGRTDLLLNKYNEALELNPENELFLYNRGALYDSYNMEATKLARTYSDTSVTLSKKTRNEKVPATKAKFDGAAKSYASKADSLTKLAKSYVSKSEADYNKAIEVNPDYLDAYYNLGALTNNKTTEIVEKMNSVKGATQEEYNKKFAALKKVQDSILYVALGHFSKALELADAMPEDTKEKKEYKNSTLNSVLYSMQQVYANLGDEKKTMEMMNRRKELDN